MKPITITNANKTTIQEFRGVKLEIARSNSTEYIAKLRDETKPYQRDVEENNLSVEKDIEITSKALAGTVLVNWEPFKMANGETIKFSVENAANLLQSDPDCRRFVLDISRTASLFEKKAEDDIVEK